MPPKRDPKPIQPGTAAANPKKRKLDQIDTSSQVVPDRPKRRRGNDAGAIPSTAPVQIQGQDQTLVAATLSDQKSGQPLAPPVLSISTTKLSLTSATALSATASAASARSSSGRRRIPEETKEPAQPLPLTMPVTASPDPLYPNLCPLFRPKAFTDHSASKLASVTRYVEVTMWELLEKVRKEEKDGHRKPGEDEKCCICLGELYDDLEIKPESDVKGLHD